MTYYTVKQASFDEALLEHYDENMDFVNYHKVLDRMKANGYTPTGNGAPREEPYYGAPFVKEYNQ